MSMVVDDAARVIRWLDEAGAVVRERTFSEPEWADASAVSDGTLPPQLESVRACRQALADAVQLAALSPYPTPEEQAIIDAQVSASLALFRALTDPPADVTALAAAVLTLEVQR